MADSVLMEVNGRPLKIRKLDKAYEGSKPSTKELKVGNVDDDEYLRQYLKLHYEFEKSEGFTVNWEQFDYVFHIGTLDDSKHFSDRRSNAEWISELTLIAIEKHNEAQGTKLVFVEHVAANYKISSGLLCWLTFWAIDMAAATPVSKIYQAKVWQRGKLFKTYMFRLKPTDEENDSVEVEPPSPMPYDDIDKPPVAFLRADPKDGALPGVPFIFDRTGAFLVRDRYGPW